MALFHECTPQCAQKELDTADIVREAMLRQLPFRAGVVRFGGRCPIKWFGPVSRILIGVFFINAAQAEMTNQHDGN